MFRKKKSNTLQDVEKNLQNLKKVLPPQEPENRNLMVKDLLNDLVREAEVNKRIKEKLNETFDRQVMIQDTRQHRHTMESGQLYTNTTFASFASSAMVLNSYPY